ncbi:saccharopine dehydrogenase [Fennellomyces sp. T-0311]|nr:saccharopine dehydrogenase [Fennellomyces sp. T-0311]
MAAKHDITVFGATGLTGRHIVEHVFELSVSHPEMYGNDFQWAIAGRNVEYMNELIDTYMSKYPGSKIPKPAVIQANVMRRDTIDAMTKQSKVIINAVGPFRFMGEYVVRSCVENGCDYVDVTGEPEFVERMQRTYHEQARKNNTTIIHCCGFDSVKPSQLYEARGWTPVHIEMYIRIHCGEAGLHAGYATYESAVHGVGSAELLKEIRKVSALEPLPRPGPPLKLRKGVNYNNDMQGYTFPFPGSDASIVRLSQQLFLTGYAQPPKPSSKPMPPTVQFAAYMVMPTFSIMLLVCFYGIIFSFLAGTPWGRNFLLKHPERFTHGVFSKQEPTDEQLQQTSFEIVLQSKGYKSNAILAGEPDCAAKVIIRGPELGYIATPRMVLQCAFTLLNGKSSDQVPLGVLTPSVAFWNTDLLKRLETVGITFEQSLE